VHNLLILGGSGLIGSVLARDASKRYRVTATYNSQEPPEIAGVSWLACRLPDDFERLEEFVHRSSADTVIDCVALSNVDTCERERNRADLLNVELPKRLAVICDKTGTRLVYLSTEYVFDGLRGNYTETDTPKPINYYGMTKLLGEQATLDFRRNLVVRTSLVYGWHKRCRFLNFVVDNLRATRAMGLYSDQMTCPTLLGDLTSGIVHALEKNASGIYHMTGPECVSRYEFGRSIASHMRLDVSLLSELRATHANTLAKRPANSCLSNKKACSVLGLTFADIDTGLTGVTKDSSKP